VSSNLIAGGGKETAGDGYAGILMPYTETDALWQVFNRTYLLVYPPQDEALVNAILSTYGPTDDGLAMWQAGEQTALRETAATPANAFAWFNLGTSLWNQGRAEEAAAAFDQARTIGLPWRMLWYQFAPFATYHAVGRNQDVIDLANATLANVDSVEEVYYWKGVALQALGDGVSARAALERALALAPGYADAASALGRLQ
jgi:tetratricopeptide (TPR) repeat protein